MRKIHEDCPPPVKDLKTVFYGWLMPDGKLYPCKYHGHDRLAQYLGFKHSSEIERLGGAVKLMNEAMFDAGIKERSFFISDCDRLNWEQITQAQRDTIFDYAVAHDVELAEVAGCLDCPYDSAPENL